MDQPGDADRPERQDAASGPGPRETDPRRFPFRITCERCREFRHTLQAMRWHLKGCPGWGGVRPLLPRDQFLGRNVCTSQPAWYRAGGSVPAQISPGRRTAQAAPAPIPPPVSSPVSGDVDTAGVHDPSSQGLRDAPSTPPRGKAASVTPPPLAAPRVERDAVPRSSPEACLPPISVAGSPGGCGDVDPDDPVGQFLPSPGRPHTSEDWFTCDDPLL